MILSNIFFNYLRFQIESLTIDGKLLMLSKKQIRGENYS